MNKTNLQTLENYGFLFFLFAIVSLTGIIWGYKNIPETNGLSLEQIEDLWSEGKQANEF